MFSLKWKCQKCGAGFLTSELLNMHSEVFHKNQENKEITYVQDETSQSEDESCVDKSQIKFDNKLSGLRVVKKFYKVTPETSTVLKADHSDSCVTEEEYLEDFSADESQKTSENEDACILVIGENGNKQQSPANKSKNNDNAPQDTEYLSEEYDTDASDPSWNDGRSKNATGSAYTPRSKMQMSTVLQFKCKRCEQVFSTKHERRLHMESHAKDLRFFCKTCGRGFRKNQGLLLHLNVHTKGSKHQCPYCHNFYRTDRYLKEHIKLHMPEEYKFECEICPKSFAHKTAFKYHMRAHYNIIPYVCNICGKGYRQKPSLDSHMDMHRGARPLACDTCGASFRARQALRDHERLHSSDTPFSCKYPGCQKSFLLKNQLKTHWMTHSERRQPQDKSFPFDSMRRREQSRGAECLDAEEGQIVMTDHVQAVLVEG